MGHPSNRWRRATSLPTVPALALPGTLGSGVPYLNTFFWHLLLKRTITRKSKKKCLYIFLLGYFKAQDKQLEILVGSAQGCSREAICIPRALSLGQVSAEYCFASRPRILSQSDDTNFPGQSPFHFGSDFRCRRAPRSQLSEEHQRPKLHLRVVWQMLQGEGLCPPPMRRR